MATFAKAAYNASAYGAFRPTYPKKLYDIILAYHRAGRGRCVDLGCGTGQATLVWADHFSDVTGIDPSPKMLDAANKKLPQEKRGSVNYVHSPAEDLSFLPDNSVDMVAAAQSCHWFEYPKVWNEVSRVLKPLGTAAFWVYADFRIRGHPATTPFIEKFVTGSGPYDVGPCWQEPGRSILQNHLRELPPPDPALLADRAHLVFADGWYPPSKHPGADVREVIMSKPATLEALEAYMRTWSAVHTYLERFPDVAARRGHGAEGDVVDRIISKLRGILEEGGVRGDSTFTQDTAMVLLLYRKPSPQ